MLTDVSGAGNNWAHGHHYYGPQYGDSIMELVRMEAEQCDSLQGALLLHSLGGGTGSGLGSYLLGKLEVCMDVILSTISSCMLLSLCCMRVSVTYYHIIHLPYYAIMSAAFFL